MAWRSALYVDRCERDGVEPKVGDSPLEEFREWRLYNMRTSAALDESRTLREQDVRNGDVFLFTNLAEEIAFALARTRAIPKSMNPEDHPYAEKLSLRELSESQRRAPAPPINNPWISGSFFLAAMVVMIVLLAVMSRVVNPFVLPLTLVAAPLFVITIGVLQLKNDERLKDKNFMELIVLVMKSLPLLRGRFLPKPEEHG
jgi:hypothetical protein